MTIILISNGKEEYITIPNEAIRIRVISNSNDNYDVEKKEKLKDRLNIKLNELISSVDNINNAREIIKNNLENINSFVDKTLKELNYDIDYNLNFGYNFFPEKIFNDILYNSGYYESLVVTLGSGKGPNYWCVLYPPLCSIDNRDNAEYKILIKEIIDKYL